MNLGFAYYAKWFTTVADQAEVCEANPIGCPMVPLEFANGTDDGMSGAMTFETANMAAAPTNLTTSTDGSCGFSLATKCTTGNCCGQYGFW